MRNGGKHARHGATNGVEKFSSSNGVGSRNQRSVLDGGLEDDERGRSGLKRAEEVDEFDEREDLIAWRLPGTVD